VIRERTLQNLIIGLALSLLVHASIVIWGPHLSVPTADQRPPTELEVQLRDWPVPPSTVPPLASARVEEPPPAPLPPAKPSRPPNTYALQEAVQAAQTEAGGDRLEVELPQQTPSLPPLDSPTDPVRLAEALRDSLRHAPHVDDSAVLPDLPAPERKLAEAKNLPPLPALEPLVQREPVRTRPPTMTLPAPHATAPIKGPASERQVLFQPPPPKVNVESESEIELRFWLLPNGSVSRVVPVKKSDPRLEALAINYLRQWRFTPLPSDAPPDEQWGIIPFKFRIR
jgi:TonB family protein